MATLEQQGLLEQGLDQQELPPLEELPPPPTRAAKPRVATSSTSSRGSRSASPRASKDKKDRDLEDIRTGIEDLFTQLGVMTSPFLAYTSVVATNRAGETADRMVRLAEADPRVRRALLRVVRDNAYLGAAYIVSYLGTAVAVDLGAMAPEALIPSKLIGPEIAIVQAERLHRQASPDGAGVPEPQWAAGSTG
jgi:hypothetical protein